jgi:hypothetical protein
MTRIDSLIQQAIDHDVIAIESAVGCTDFEIDQIRTSQGVSQLPSSYVTFLRRLGRQAGRLLHGTDAFYPGLLGLKSAGRELLLEDTAEEELGPDSFVIGMHQGYQLFWFPSVLEEEPPVLMYQEGDRRRVREWADFSHYIEDMISEVDRR